MDEKAIQIAAYQNSFGQRRQMIKWLCAAALISMGTGLWFALQPESRDLGDAVIFSVGGVLFFLSSMSLYLVPQSKLYPVILLWVSTILLITGALVMNTLFGSRYAMVLQDRLPAVMSFVPAVIVFAYTYLAPRHARWAVGMMSAILGLAAIAYLTIFWPQAITGAGPVFLVLSFCLVNPVIMALMHIHQTTYGDVQRRLSQAEQVADQERRMAERARMTDPATYSMNKTGVFQSLKQMTQAQRQMLLIAIEPKEIKRLAICEKDEVELYLRRLTDVMRACLGAQFEFGRISEWQLLAWANAEEVAITKADLQAVMQKMRSLRVRSRIGGEVHLGASVSALGEDAAFVVEEAEFQLFLARSRSLDMVISPVAENVLLPEADSIVQV